MSEHFIFSENIIYPVQFLSWRFAPVHGVVCTGKERQVGDIKKKSAL